MIIAKDAYTKSDVLVIIPVGKDIFSDPSSFFLPDSIASCKREGVEFSVCQGPSPMMGRMKIFRRYFSENVPKPTWYLWLDSDDELADGCVDAFLAAANANRKAVFLHGRHEGEKIRPYCYEQYQKGPGISAPYFVHRDVMRRFADNLYGLPRDGVGLNYAYFRAYLNKMDVVLSVPDAMIVRRYHEGSMSVRNKQELVRRLVRFRKGKYDLR